MYSKQRAKVSTLCTALSALPLLSDLYFVDVFRGMFMCLLAAMNSGALSKNKLMIFLVPW